MHYLTLILKNVARRPARSILTISGIAVAVMAVVALVGIAGGFERSYLSLYKNRGADLMVVRAGSTQQVSSVLDARLGTRIAGLPGVEEVSPTLVDVVSFEEKDLVGVVIQGLPVESRTVQNLAIVDGRRVKTGDVRAVMVGGILAKSLEKKAGDTVELLEGESFDVVGVYESQNVFENGSLILAIEELQALMMREGDVTMFTVIASQKDRGSLEELARQIKALEQGLEALPAREYVDSTVEIRMARAVAWSTSSIALLIGTIGMINTMLTSVFERTRELALLRAIGWRKRSVVQLVLVESMVMGVLGALVGSLAAIGLTRLLGSLPASGRLISGDIAGTVILQGVAIAIVVGLAGGIYPAYRAAGLMPTEGLRHE